MVAAVGTIVWCEMRVTRRPATIGRVGDRNAQLNWQKPGGQKHRAVDIGQGQIVEQ